MTNPHPDQQQGFGQPAQQFGQPQPGGQRPGVFGEQSGFQQPGVTPGGYQPAAYSVEHPARPHVGFGEAVKAFFKNYATFKGRASRSEFWWAYLFLTIVSTVLGILFAIGVAMVQKETYTVGGEPYEVSKGIGSSPLGVIAMFLLGLWWLAIIVPTLALQVRRLHDTNKPGLFVLLHLIPNIGSLIVLVLCALQSDPAGVRFDDESGKQPHPVPTQAPGATPYQG